MKFLFTCVFLAVATTAHADHEIAIYAVDGTLPLPHQSHLFALIDGKHSISWLPKDGVIRARATRPEPGKNFSYEETLDWAKDRSVTLVGKAAITNEQYEAALKHIKLLESGDIKYKMLDARFYPEASNCIHAVSTIFGTGETGLVYGTRSGERVLEIIREVNRVSKK